MSLLGTKKNARGFTQDYTSHATMNTVAVLVNNMEGRLDSLHAPLDHTILLYHGSYYLLLLPLLLIVYTIYIFIYIYYIYTWYIYIPPLRCGINFALRQGILCSCAAFPPWRGSSICTHLLFFYRSVLLYTGFINMLPSVIYETVQACRPEQCPPRLRHAIASRMFTDLVPGIWYQWPPWTVEEGGIVISFVRAYSRTGATE